MVKSSLLAYKYPENYSRLDNDIFYFIERSEELPKFYLTSLENGWWNVARKKRINAFEFKIILFLNKIKNKKVFINISSGTWIIDHFYWINYFHWFNDLLPKLIFLENKGIKCDVLLPEHAAHLNFVVESLKMIGWSYKTVSFNSICHFEKIFVPDIQHGDGKQHPVYFQQIVSRLRGVNVSMPFRKVFIHRNNSTTRNIVRFEEIKSLLESFAIEIIETDNLPFQQQIDLFKECSHIIGVHGAGLTNMIFMKEHSSVLEIRRSDDNLNFCFFKMANVLRHNYYYLLAEPENVRKKIQDDNVVVDIEKMKIALNQFLGLANP